MTNTWAIARRELRSYFSTPMGYAILGVFLLAAGLIYAVNLKYIYDVSVLANIAIKKYGIEQGAMNAPAMFYESFHGELCSALLVLFPMITMGLVAEEKRRGTMELLMTSPVRPLEIVAGKFLAAFFFYLAMIVPIMCYQGYIFAFGDVSWGPWVTGNLGLVLLGFAVLPLGLYISTRTISQLVAAFFSLAVIMIFWRFDGLERYAHHIWRDFVGWFSLYMHFTNFSKGVIDLMDVWFYLCFGTFWLLLSWRELLALRWRGFERR